MARYKYPFGSIWISHSSLTDFAKCPRLYYLRNVYKDPKRGKKIQVVNPSLTLGQIVHDTLERIRYLPKNVRFTFSLTDIFQEIWDKNSGQLGGFVSPKQEAEFKNRGLLMITRVQNHPGPLANLSTIIKDPGEKVANMQLSPIDNLVLCGNVDWVEVLADGSLHIIDFKTGKNTEDSSSLQLQIYLLLAQHNNKRPVTRLSYWYLEKDDAPTPIVIPPLAGVVEQLISQGRLIKAARLQYPAGSSCLSGGCRHCTEYERVLSGQCQEVGFDPIREKILYLFNQ